MGMGDKGDGSAQLSFAVDLSPEAVRVVLRGEADVATSSILRDTLLEAASLHPAVEVDLRQLEFIETSCVRVLLDTHGQVVSGGGTMRVLIAGGTVRRVFDLLGIDEQLSVQRASTARGGGDSTVRPPWDP
jgi:anti-sigma B factor antagonist